jgi:hypothetical protein
MALATLFTVLAPNDAAAQRGDRYDRRMVIINESRFIIKALHATNTSVPVWGGDLLRDDIYPGERRVVDFTDGTGYCMFDFKAVLQDGRAVERYRVNVCEAVSWTIH